MRFENWTLPPNPLPRVMESPHLIGWNVPPDELKYIQEHWLVYPEPDKSLHLLLGLVYIFFFIMSIVGNGIVIWIFTSAKSLRTASNMFVVNLAFCDFMMMLKAPIFIYNSFHGGFALGMLGCRVFATMGSLSGIGQGMTNACIAYDRFTTITRPFDGKVSRTKALVMILFVWAYTIPWALMPLFEIWGRFGPGEKMNVESLRANQQGQTESAELRIAKAAITVCGLFVASWTPYAVMALIGGFGDQSLLTPGVSMIPALACKLVACIDPYVYAISHPKFRSVIRYCSVFQSSIMSEVQTPATDSFTCVTCRVTFRDSDLQRTHYKSDWHRYNLKRKVAEFPPVTEEDFQKRSSSQRNTSKKPSEVKHVYCEACHKSFSSQNAHDNHLQSKKHKDNVNRGHSQETSIQQPAMLITKFHSHALSETESDILVEELDSDEWEDESENPIDNNDCIFCSHHSKNFIKNLEHMTVAHSFFIPDIEYCVDVMELLRYLGEKVSEGFMCLWCNEKGRTFHSAEAARQHMVDKGHCKMIHEGEALAEYADFYDYSTSYPDATNDEVDADEEIDVPELDGGDYQLVLPSGAKVGHRSLFRYYRQSFNPNRVVVPSKNSRKLHKVLATYRALGWSETQQAAAARKARDIHYMKRIQAKHRVKMGMKHNEVLQKHFRRQVQF
nr:unnamed protein product [Callosobruchus chinensis]